KVKRMLEEKGMCPMDAERATPLVLPLLHFSFPLCLPFHVPLLGAGAAVGEEASPVSDAPDWIRSVCNALALTIIAR
ncbi:MAG: hypothetical protein ACKPKO_09175, partial [Candidatus Fonsibacter sp.]